VPSPSGLEPRTLLSVTIQLDYSLDTSNFFNTQAKKDLMQLAANSVAGSLGDSLAAIVPSGGNTWTGTIMDALVGFNQSFMNLDVAANTIIVFVKGSALPGTGEAGLGITGGFTNASGTQDWLNTVAARGQTGALSATPHDFGPWGGAILFDNTGATNWFFGQTTAGLSFNQTDFLTVAEHELGHVLGIGTAPSWFSDVNSDVKSGAGTFVGPSAEAAHGGTPVPLDARTGLSHWADGTTSDGQNATMDPILFDGNRTLFTTLDYAGLADVGWQVQAPNTPSAPVLDPFSDTGVSNSDGITRDNGSAAAPLTFHVAGVSPANGFVRLYEGANLLAGPVQAFGGSATITVTGTRLADGLHNITATGSATSTGAQSAPSPPTPVTIWTSLTIVSTSPADHSYNPALPGGQVAFTFSHPLAGLANGGVAITAARPFAAALLPLGPDRTMSAPFGLDSGNLPVHTDTLYRTNPDGTSTITLTPTSPLSTDIFVVGVDPAFYTDLAGNPLTDAGGGYRSFLLQLPPAGVPLQVNSVTEFNGFAAINNNAVFQPDTIAINFNQALYPGVVGGANANKVQLLDTAAGYTPVPSAVAYSPTTRSIYLTPEAALQPGRTYLIRVDGSVSNDQGFGGPGGAMGQPFYDSFSVINPPAPTSTGSLQVVRDASGNPVTLPQSAVNWTLPVGYASVSFTEAVNLASLGRFSATLKPRKGGLSDTGNYDNADSPLNAKLAFNPNTDRLIIVPTQPMGNDLYLFALSAMTSMSGDPLTNPGGVLPVSSSFQLSVPGGGSASAMSAPAVSAALVTSPAVPGVVPGAGSVPSPAVTEASVSRSVQIRPNVAVGRTLVRQGAASKPAAESVWLAALEELASGSPRRG
jgi:hypothetical protein